MLSPLWTRQNIQVQKSVVLITEELAHNLSQSCEKRLFSLYRLWSDEGVTVLISRCLAPWRKDRYIKIP